MTGRVDLRAVLLAIAAPVIAVAFALLVSSGVLAAAGDPVGTTWEQLARAWEQPRRIAETVNQATYLYLAALAVALGFRMNLFNIGVEGQYLLAAFSAAAVCGRIALPFPLSIALGVVVAMLVGAAWAGIAAVLKVTRGVSEVISTIMLNSIAGALVAFLLRQVAVPVAGSNNIGTEPLSESARVPGLPLVPGSPREVFGLVVLAALAGAAFHVLVNRTRFGFDLRATGRSRTAAVASGIDVRRMVIVAMLLSGGMAGLVGLPLLFGEAYSYSLTFPAGVGFTGIAIALLGRNNPAGIALAALLFAYLNVAAEPLQIRAGVASEIVQIMQGIIVLAVVVAYELVNRYRVAAEQRRVARELADRPGVDRPAGARA